MVLEIHLANFFSIQSEVILELRAGTLNTTQSRRLTANVVEHKNQEVLKTIGIFGANASGKSNILKAIRLCVNIVTTSHLNNENSVFPFQPFKFEGYPQKPSRFFIRFIHEEVEYEYAFSLTQQKILTESLYHYPNGRRAKVFERDERLGNAKKEKYSFGGSVIKRPLDVAKSTSEKALFISRASQMDRDIPKKIFHFFDRQFVTAPNYAGYTNLYKLPDETKIHLLKALRLADSDIIDFSQKMVPKPFQHSPSNPFVLEDRMEWPKSQEIKIETHHRTAPEVSFDLMTEESDGTRKLFFLVLTFLDAIKNNKLLIMDEIGTSLHLHVVNYLIQLFHSGEKAQLIFSSHHTYLLDLNKFRKDQVWFVNKTKSGNSELYSLYDFSDFRDTMDLEKAYLQGRFDSVPIMAYAMPDLEALTRN
ncbi:MAG: ATP-binding protein [Bacteroidota bacterium]